MAGCNALACVSMSNLVETGEAAALTQVHPVKDPISVAAIAVETDHAKVDMGVQMQCLATVLQAAQPLQVVRLTGPDVCIGALSALAAYPSLLLQAAEVRQVRAQAGFDPDKCSSDSVQYFQCNLMATASCLQ